MPTIFRKGPYRFYFYASDRDEPLHVHVERDDKVAKFWLAPTRLQYSEGFNRGELSQIRTVIDENLTKITEAWNVYFGN